MARKTKEVTVPPGRPYERDVGKKFHLTEMPASQAEFWAMRAVLAIGRSGVHVPDELLGMGMALIAFIGINKLLSVAIDDAKPLLDEMMACVQRVEPTVTRPLVEEDVEEPVTRMWLKGEVFELHTGFSVGGMISESLAETASRLMRISETTQTSPSPSDRSSPDGSPPVMN